MDQVNPSIISMYQKSSVNIFRALWEDWCEPKVTDNSLKGTLSNTHREALNHILATLRSTNTNFVRCIIPNLAKKSAKVDGGLMLNQLRANGVMQGARICRIGYPDKMKYADFRHRYEIVNKKALPDKVIDNKKATEIILRTLELGKLFNL